MWDKGDLYLFPDKKSKKKGLQEDQLLPKVLGVKAPAQEHRLVDRFTSAPGQHAVQGLQLLQPQAANSK